MYDSHKIIMGKYSIVSVGEWLIRITGLQCGTYQHMNKIANEEKNLL